MNAEQTRVRDVVMRAIGTLEAMAEQVGRELREAKLSQPEWIELAVALAKQHLPRDMRETWVDGMIAALPSIWVNAGMDPGKVGEIVAILQKIRGPVLHVVPKDQTG